MRVDRRTLLSAAALVPLAGVAARAEDRGTAFTVAGLPGRLTRYEVTPAHAAPRRVDVWDPVEDHAGPRALLVMHDGQNVFDPASAYGGHTWGVADVVTKLAASDAAFRVPVVVGVWNTPLRWREYMPERMLKRLPARIRAEMEAEQGGAGVSDGYQRFLAEELLPFVRARHPVSPAPATIMGSSMGGLASLAAVAEHPAAFVGAGCLSTHWPFSDPRKSERATAIRMAATRYIAEVLGPPRGRKLWLDHGDQTLDQYYAPYQANADAALDAAGWRRGVDYQSRAYPGASHSEPSWRARLADPLGFLLGAHG